MILPICIVFCMCAFVGVLHLTDDGFDIFDFTDLLWASLLSFITGILLAVLISVFIKNSFDKNIEKYPAKEFQIIEDRHDYYINYDSTFIRTYPKNVKVVIDSTSFIEIISFKENKDPINSWTFIKQTPNLKYVLHVRDFKDLKVLKIPDEN